MQVLFFVFIFFNVDSKLDSPAYLEVQWPM